MSDSLDNGLQKVRGKQKVEILFAQNLAEKVKKNYLSDGQIDRANEALAFVERTGPEIYSEIISLVEKRRSLSATAAIRDYLRKGYDVTIAATDEEADIEELALRRLERIANEINSPIGSALVTMCLTEDMEQDLNQQGLLYNLKEHPSGDPSLVEKTPKPLGRLFEQYRNVLEDVAENPRNADYVKKLSTLIKEYRGGDCRVLKFSQVLE